ncbi:MAG: tRNA pseudouridine(55) synthase TruB [Oscillospiraceae bacterium]|nr:tRNA pseudouridine(55) synthase TruB [Oscillospiraceae bacterium]
MSGIAVIDKPSGWTSFDVCAKIRGVMRAVTGEKKIKVGHGGTLDPLATGVLPVFIGREYTKLVSSCESADKEYTAGVRFGIVTDTQDIDGTVLSRTEASVTRDALEAALAAFRGELLQTPPMYSAVKVNGQRLYAAARRGIEVPREPRRITVYGAEIVSADGAGCVLRFTVSKGTYIRTLCHDLGQSLGCGAALTALRRTRAGAFRIEDAVTPEEFQRRAADNTLETLLLKDIPR